MIQVAIYAETAVMRAGLAGLVSQFQDFEILFTIGSVEELEERLDDEVAWVVHAGLGLEGVVNLLAQKPRPVLLIGDDETIAGRSVTFPAGGWGVVRNTISAGGLRAAILAVSEGLIVQSPGTGTPGRAALNAAEPEGKLLEPLTEREQMVLEKLAAGLANKQIAQALDISENTVKFHISSIYSKLNASSRTDALRKGAKLGLVAL